MAGQLRIGLGDRRQFNTKSRAFTQHSTGSGQRAAVRFDNRLANREPEPKAGNALLDGMHLEEGFEQMEQRPWLNPDACVAKLDGQTGSLVAARFDRNASARGREFDGVLDQVPKDLLESASIRVHK